MARPAMTPASASALASIPRFLLPRRGPLWQQPGLLRDPAGLLRPGRSSHGGTGASSARSYASSAQPPPSSSASAASAASPSNILEKPARFNPPSHGSRLPRKNQAGQRPASAHYGGDLSAADRAAQRARQYPGLMAPPGTWSHWFWTSRSLHLAITTGTLAALALYTFFESFRRTSPYADMLPSGSDICAHPIRSARLAIEVVRLTESRRAAEVAERRQQRVDDVAKRTLYRKAHGLEETVGFGSGWLRKSGSGEAGTAAAAADDAPPPPARNEAAVAVDDASPVRVDNGAAIKEATEPEKRKRFLGVF